MPKVRRSRKRPPEGWELIEPTLDELDQKMREGRSITRTCKQEGVLKLTVDIGRLILSAYSFSSRHVAETESHEGKRRVEALWPIFK